MSEQAATERDGAGGLPKIHASRFVARAGELAALTSALAGPRAVVLVEGETGIGKSRLVQEYLATTDETTPTASVSPGIMLMIWPRFSRTVGAEMQTAAIAAPLVPRTASRRPRPRARSPGSWCRNHPKHAIPLKDQQQLQRVIDGLDWIGRRLILQNRTISTNSSADRMFTVA
jgi:hypothetical protein